VLPGLRSRRFGRDVIWNLASLAILAASGLVINIVIARCCGADALGVFNQVFAVYIMLSQFAVGGVHLSVLKQVSYHQSDPRQAAMAATSGLALATSLASLVAMATFLLKDACAWALDSRPVAQGVALIAPGLLFFSLNKVLLSILNGLRFMRAYAVFQSLRFVLILAAIGAIIAAGWPDAWLAGSLSIAEFLLFAALSLYVAAAVVPIRIGDARHDMMREHLRFGLRGFGSGVLSEINTRVDVLMLGWFTSDARVGIYSFAAILAEGFGQIPAVVRRNVDPILGLHFADGTVRQIRSFTRRVKHGTYLAMVAICLVAVAAYPLAITWVVRDQALAASSPVFAILMIGIALSAGYRPFFGLLLQGGRPGAHTFCTALVVGLNVVLNAALIPFLGVHGAAVATMIVWVLEAVLVACCGRALFGVRL
jgi:O-antigen/teichoic acid export membrane protein